MAKDADGDYFYVEGTVNELMDDWAVYEKDGRVSLHYKPTDNEVSFTDLAVMLEAQRAAPDTDELADGEQMIYQADGSAANSAAGDLVVARNNSGTIEEAVLALAGTDFAGV